MPNIGSKINNSKGEIDSCTIVGDFNIPLSIMDTISRKKIEDQ